MLIIDFTIFCSTRVTGNAEKAYKLVTGEFNIQVVKVGADGQKKDPKPVKVGPSPKKKGPAPRPFLERRLRSQNQSMKQASKSTEDESNDGQPASGEKEVSFG